jgi:catechol 2,3-dioxygenase-like lactoylglutathione lyase family enzyme
MSPAKTHITGIRAVSIPVENQDDALRFYTGTLGFTTLRDAPTPTGGRFIELAPGHASVVITLEPAAPDVTRGAIGIRFTTDDADNAHAALTAAGVDTDEILRWPGVPAMFSFRDPDGNAFSITEVP